MNSVFILCLVIVTINGQVILHNKDYAMLEQEIMQNIRRPVLELINAFLDETKKQFDQVEQNQKTLSEGLQALINREEQNQKTLSEGIQALNNTVLQNQKMSSERMQALIDREEQNQKTLSEGIQALNNTVLQNQKMSSERIQALINREEQNQKTLSEGIQALNNTVLQNQNTSSERIQALINREEQNQKTLSEGIQALNKTLATRSQRQDKRDGNCSRLAKEQQEQLTSQAAEIDVLRRGLASVQQQLIQSYERDANCSRLVKEQKELLTSQAAEIDDLRRVLASLTQQLTKSCPDFHIDETTLHSNRYLSEDRKTLFNTRCSADEERQGTACSYDWPVGSYTKYHGTRGSLLINPPDQIYFEVNVTYNIIKDLQNRNLVFEVGIAREEIIDLSHYVGNNQYGWSVYAARDNTTGQVEIDCQNKKVLYSDTLSKCISGTSKTLTLGIYVNAEDNEMSVVDVDRDVLMYTFTDIDFTQPLRPVFGAYNHDYVHVTMQLKTRTCISGLPKCLQK